MSVVSTPVDVVRNTFNFSVDKFPLSGPDNLATPYYGLFKSDNSECLNVVSDQYYVHTTDDVCALVEAAQSAFDDDCSVRAWWNKGHHVIIVPSKDHRRAIFGTADNISPRFKISAGYNDKTVSVSLGMFRDACLNLAIMQTISEFTTKIMHRQSMRPRMDELIKSFQSLRDGWKSLSDLMAHMQSREVSLVSFLDAVYPLDADADKRAVTIHKNRTEEIFLRLKDERYRTGRPAMDSRFMVSAYEAFNAVQGYVQHVSYAKKSQFDQILAASNSPAVKRAEELAISA